ncbi:MAG: hypothetical protein AUI14_19685 [Actinobacteria bacterium 13_2_20CM_2_71_6]|nr:MAG: hypothetical protein AUI14_19685 [Actinobacteria bacterium 13_2_20CM_2_71_6]
MFSHEPPTPPVREQRGEWRFTALSDGSTLVEMTHIVTADDAAVAERITEDHDRTAPIQLGGYQKVAELGPRLPELVVPYADSVLLDGTVEDVFAALLADGTWADGPVTTTPLAADADLITFGGADSQPVRCLRLLFPADRIVFKFLDVPGWLGAHVGTWRLRPEGDRVHVRREHFATLSPRALAEPPHALAELRDRAARHLHEDASRVATAVRRSLPEPAVSAVSA